MPAPQSVPLLDAAALQAAATAVGPVQTAAPAGPLAGRSRRRALRAEVRATLVYLPVAESAQLTRRVCVVVGCRGPGAQTQPDISRERPG